MENNKARKTIRGVVIGNSMQKTVKVQIVTKERHPKYQKIVEKRIKLLAHTEEPIEIGTEVEVVESKPISKRVRWVVNSKSEG